MQNPCRPPTAALARPENSGASRHGRTAKEALRSAHGALLLGLACTLPSLAMANTPSSITAAASPTKAVPAAAAPASAAPSSLTDSARTWVARQLAMPVAKVQVFSPDPRLRTPRCQTPLQFDAPFSNLNTVRVRCAEPAWQLYLRAQWDEPEATPGPAHSAETRTAGPTPSPAAAANAQPNAQSNANTAATAPPNREPRRALAPVQSVSRGALLTPASVDWVMVPAREADSTLVTDPQALQQSEAVRDLPAGQPLRHTDIRAAVLVRQGQQVTLTVGQGSGFTITVRLEALQDGRMGDRVMLRNSESGRTVSGVVTGLNAARGA